MRIFFAGGGSLLLLWGVIAVVSHGYRQLADWQVREPMSALKDAIAPASAITGGLGLGALAFFVSIWLWNWALE